MDLDWNEDGIPWNDTGQTDRGHQELSEDELNTEAEQEELTKATPPKKPPRKLQQSMAEGKLLTHEMFEFNNPKIQFEQYAVVINEYPLAYNTLSEFVDGEKVLDLCAGKGGFSIPLLDNMRSLKLVELDPDVFSELEKVVDSISTEKLQCCEDDAISVDKSQHDVIICNPPFGTKQNYVIMRSIIKAINKGGTRKAAILMINKHAEDVVKLMTKYVLENIVGIKIKLPKTYRHHKKDEITIPCSLLLFKLGKGERSSVIQDRLVLTRIQSSEDDSYMEEYEPFSKESVIPERFGYLVRKIVNGLIGVAVYNTGETVMTLRNDPDIQQDSWVDIMQLFEMDRTGSLLQILPEQFRTFEGLKFTKFMESAINLSSTVAHLAPDPSWMRFIPMLHPNIIRSAALIALGYLICSISRDWDYQFRKSVFEGVTGMQPSKKLSQLCLSNSLHDNLLGLCKTAFLSNFDYNVHEFKDSLDRMRLTDLALLSSINLEDLEIPIYVDLVNSLSTKGSTYNDIGKNKPMEIQELENLVLDLESESEKKKIADSCFSHIETVLHRLKDRETGINSAPYLTLLSPGVMGILIKCLGKGRRFTETYTQLWEDLTSDKKITVEVLKDVKETDLLLTTTLTPEEMENTKDLWNTLSLMSNVLLPSSINYRFNKQVKTVDKCPTTPSNEEATCDENAPVADEGETHGPNLTEEEITDSLSHRPDGEATAEDPHDTDTFNFETSIDETVESDMYVRQENAIRVIRKEGTNLFITVTGKGGRVSPILTNKLYTAGLKELYKVLDPKTREVSKELRWTTNNTMLSKLSALVKFILTHLSNFQHKFNELVSRKIKDTCKSFFLKKEIYKMVSNTGSIQSVDNIMSVITYTYKLVQVRDSDSKYSLEDGSFLDGLRVRLDKLNSMSEIIPVDQVIREFEGHIRNLKNSAPLSAHKDIDGLADLFSASQGYSDMWDTCIRIKGVVYEAFFSAAYNLTYRSEEYKPNLLHLIKNYFPDKEQEFIRRTANSPFIRELKPDFFVLSDRFSRSIRSGGGHGMQQILAPQPGSLIWECSKEKFEFTNPITGSLVKVPIWALPSDIDLNVKPSGTDKRNDGIKPEQPTDSSTKKEVQIKELMDLSELAQFKESYDKERFRKGNANQTVPYIKPFGQHEQRTDLEDSASVVDTDTADNQILLGKDEDILSDISFFKKTDLNKLVQTDLDTGTGIAVNRLLESASQKESVGGLIDNNGTIVKVYKMPVSRRSGIEERNKESDKQLLDKDKELSNLIVAEQTEREPKTEITAGLEQNVKTEEVDSKSTDYVIEDGVVIYNRESWDGIKDSDLGESDLTIIEVGYQTAQEEKTLTDLKKWDQPLQVLRSLGIDCSCVVAVDTTDNTDDHWWLPNRFITPIRKIVSRLFNVLTENSPPSLISQMFSNISTQKLRTMIRGSKEVRPPTTVEEINMFAEKTIDRISVRPSGCILPTDLKQSIRTALVDGTFMSEEAKDNSLSKGTEAIESIFDDIVRLIDKTDISVKELEFKRSACEFAKGWIMEDMEHKFAKDCEYLNEVKKTHQSKTSSVDEVSTLMSKSKFDCNCTSCIREVVSPRTCNTRIPYYQVCLPFQDSAEDLIEVEAQEEVNSRAFTVNGPLDPIVSLTLPGKTKKEQTVKNAIKSLIDGVMEINDIAAVKNSKGQVFLNSKFPVMSRNMRASPGNYTVKKGRIKKENTIEVSVATSTFNNDNKDLEDQNGYNQLEETLLPLNIRSQKKRLATLKEQMKTIKSLMVGYPEYQRRIIMSFLTILDLNEFAVEHSACELNNVQVTNLISIIGERRDPKKMISDYIDEVTKKGNIEFMKDDSVKHMSDEDIKLYLEDSISKIDSIGDEGLFKLDCVIFKEIMDECRLRYETTVYECLPPVFENVVKFLLQFKYIQDIIMYGKMCQCFLDSCAEMTFSGVHLQKIPHTDFNMICKVPSKKTGSIKCYIANNKLEAVSEAFFMTRQRATLGQSFFYCIVEVFLQTLQTHRCIDPFVLGGDLNLSKSTIYNNNLQRSQLVESIISANKGDLPSAISKLKLFKINEVSVELVDSNTVLERLTLAFNLSFNCFFGPAMLLNSRSVNKLLQTTRYPYMLSLSEFGYPMELGRKMSESCRRPEQIVLKLYLMTCCASGLWDPNFNIQGWKQKQFFPDTGMLSQTCCGFPLVSERQFLNDIYLVHLYNKEIDDFAEGSIRVLDEFASRHVKWENQLKKCVDEFNNVTLSDKKRLKGYHLARKLLCIPYYSNPYIEPGENQDDISSKGSTVDSHMYAKSKDIIVSEGSIKEGNNLEEKSHSPGSSSSKSISMIKRLERVEQKGSKKLKSDLASWSKQAQSLVSGRVIQNATEVKEFSDAEHRLFSSGHGKAYTIKSIGSRTSVDSRTSIIKVDTDRRKRQKISKDVLQYDCKEVLKEMKKYTMCVPEMIQLATMHSKQMQYNRSAIEKSTRSSRNWKSVTEFAESTSVIKTPYKVIDLKECINIVKKEKMDKLTKMISSHYDANKRHELNLPDTIKAISNLFKEDGSYDDNEINRTTGILKGKLKSEYESWQELLKNDLTFTLFSNDVNKLYHWIKGIYQTIVKLKVNCIKGNPKVCEGKCFCCMLNEENCADIKGVKKHILNKPYITRLQDTLSQSKNFEETKNIEKNLYEDFMSDWTNIIKLSLSKLSLEMPRCNREPTNKSEVKEGEKEEDYTGTTGTVKKNRGIDTLEKDDTAKIDKGVEEGVEMDRVSEITAGEGIRERLKGEKEENGIEEEDISGGTTANNFNAVVEEDKASNEQRSNSIVPTKEELRPLCDLMKKYLTLMEQKSRFPDCSFNSEENEICREEDNFIKNNSSILGRLFTTLISSSVSNPFFLTSSGKDLSIVASLLLRKDDSQRDLTNNDDSRLFGPIDLMNLEAALIKSHVFGEMSSEDISNCVRYTISAFTIYDKPIKSFAPQSIQQPRVIRTKEDMAELTKKFLGESALNHPSSEFVFNINLTKSSNLTTARKALGRKISHGLPRSIRSKVVYEIINLVSSMGKVILQEAAYAVISDPNHRSFSTLAPKAQLGGDRDLLVQELWTKLFNAASEQFAKSILENVLNDGLVTPSVKEVILERSLSKKKIADSEHGRHIEDRTGTIKEFKFHKVLCIAGDNTKWGPIHCPAAFSVMYEQLLVEFPEWRNFEKLVMLKGVDKEIEIPSACVKKVLTSFFCSREYKEILRQKKHKNNDSLKEGLKQFKSKWSWNDYMPEIIEWYISEGKGALFAYNHMGQGIHHATSSLLASIVNKFVDHLLIRRAEIMFPGCSCNIDHAGSSDDFTKVIEITGSFQKPTFNKYVEEYPQKMRKLLCYMNGLYRCNQMYVSAKSVYSSCVNEMYSEFDMYHKVSPAVVKFIISSIISGSVTTPMTLYQSTHVCAQQAMFQSASMLSNLGFCVMRQQVYYNHIENITRRVGPVTFGLPGSFGRLYVPEFHSLSVNGQLLSDIETTVQHLSYIQKFSEKKDYLPREIQERISHLNSEKTQAMLANLSSDVRKAKEILLSQYLLGSKLKPGTISYLTNRYVNGNLTKSGLNQIPSSLNVKQGNENIKQKNINKSTVESSLGASIGSEPRTQSNSEDSPVHDKTPNAITAVNPDIPEELDTNKEPETQDLNDDQDTASSVGFPVVGPGNILTSTESNKSSADVPSNYSDLSGSIPLSDNQEGALKKLSAAIEKKIGLSETHSSHSETTSPFSHWDYSDSCDHFSYRDNTFEEFLNEEIGNSIYEDIEVLSTFPKDSKTIRWMDLDVDYNHICKYLQSKITTVISSAYSGSGSGTLEKDFKANYGATDDLLFDDPFIIPLPDQVLRELVRLKVYKRGIGETVEDEHTGFDLARVVAQKLVESNCPTEDKHAELVRLKQIVHSRNIINSLAGGLKDVSVPIFRIVWRAFYFNNKVEQFDIPYWAENSDPNCVDNTLKPVGGRQKVRFTDWLTQCMKLIIKRLPSVRDFLGNSLLLTETCKDAVRIDYAKLTTNSQMSGSVAVDERDKSKGFLSVKPDHIKLACNHQMRLIIQVSDINRTNLQQLETSEILSVSAAKDIVVEKTMLFSKTEIFNTENSPAVIISYALEPNAVASAKPQGVKFHKLDDDRKALLTYIPHLNTIINSIKEEKEFNDSNAQELSRMLNNVCRLIGKGQLKTTKFYVFKAAKSEYETNLAGLISLGLIEGRCFMLQTESETTEVYSELYYRVLECISLISTMPLHGDHKTKLLLNFLQWNPAFCLSELSILGELCKNWKAEETILKQFGRESIATLLINEAKSVKRETDREKIINLANLVLSSRSLLRDVVQTDLKTVVDFKGEIGVDWTFSMSCEYGNAVGVTLEGKLVLTISNLNVSLIRKVISHIYSACRRSKRGYILTLNQVRYVISLLANYSQISGFGWNGVPKSLILTTSVDQPVVLGDPNLDSPSVLICKDILVERSFVPNIISKNINLEWTNRGLEMFINATTDNFISSSSLKIAATVITSINKEAGELFETKQRLSDQKVTICKVELPNSVSLSSWFCMHAFLWHRYSQSKPTHQLADETSKLLSKVKFGSQLNQILQDKIVQQAINLVPSSGSVEEQEELGNTDIDNLILNGAEESQPSDELLSKIKTEVSRVFRSPNQVNYVRMVLKELGYHSLIPRPKIRPDTGFTWEILDTNITKIGRGVNAGISELMNQLTGFDIPSSLSKCLLTSKDPNLLFSIAKTVSSLLQSPKISRKQFNECFSLTYHLIKGLIKSEDAIIPWSVIDLFCYPCRSKLGKTHELILRQEDSGLMIEVNCKLLPESVLNLEKLSLKKAKAMVMKSETKRTGINPSKGELSKKTTKKSVFILRKMLKDMLVEGLSNRFNLKENFSSAYTLGITGTKVRERDGVESFQSNFKLKVDELLKDYSVLYITETLLDISSKKNDFTVSICIFLMSLMFNWVPTTDEFKDLILIGSENLIKAVPQAKMLVDKSDDKVAEDGSKVKKEASIMDFLGETIDFDVEYEADGSSDGMHSGSELSDAETEIDEDDILADFGEISDEYAEDYPD